MLIRYATPDDLPALADLRNHFVANSYATFDEEPLSQAALRQWLGTFDITGPYRLLIAEELGQLIGFASSQQYRTHVAFRKTIETSIYVASPQGRTGVGSALYSGLFEAIKSEDLHRAVVGIALPNKASIRLHKKFSFTEVGIFSEYAIKNSQLISSLWMQRSL
jgi:phosphinothricin acetyltransferase